MNERWYHKLVRRFLAWRKKRREAKYKAGYAFARRALTQEIMTCQYLYDQTCESESFGHFDDYDRGVRAAIYDWELRGVEAI